MQQPRAVGPGAHAAAVALVVALAGGLYANALGGPFVFDDLPHIEKNRFVRLTRLEPGALRDAALESPALRPVAYLTFALNHVAGGLDVTGYHAVNVAIHAANGGLVYLLALLTLRRAARLPGQRCPPRAAHAAPVALLCALLFTAHPIQTQSVTYVVQRMNSLAALFSLATLLGYLAARSAATPARRWSAALGAGLCWGLALGSKQTAAVVPFAVLLYEWYFFRDLSRAWLRRGALLAAVAAAGLAWLYSGGFAAFSYAARDFDAWERVLTQLRVVVFYLSLVLLPLPSRLNLTHAFELSTSLLAPPTTLVALGVLLALLAVAIRTARAQRLVSFSLLWFFLFLALESSVVPLELVYEHRLYLPLFGAALLASHGLWRALSSRPRLAVAVAACLVAGLSAGTVVRNRTWQDAEVLWRDVVAKSPADARARYNLAHVLAGRGLREEAIRHYREALRLDPDYPQTHNGYAIELEALGRTAEALHHYTEAARLDPENAVIRTNLASLLERSGRREEALAHYREAVRIRPAAAEAHGVLGAALGRAGRLDGALHHLSEAVRLDPGDARLRQQLGTALGLAGRRAEAEQELRASVRLDPGTADARVQLAALLAAAGRPREAREQLEEALRLAPERDEARRLLEALPSGAR